MDTGSYNSKMIRMAALVLALLAVAPAASADKKKEKPDPKAAPTRINILEALDYSKIVWPNPPAITRVRYVSYFSGEKYVPKQQRKSNWMDRLSGVTTGETKDTKPRFQLLAPYGIAIDSKGFIYVADSKVGGVFVVDPAGNNFIIIGNGTHARFNTITGVAIDDADHLFVSDSGMRRVLVFDPGHRLMGSISDGMLDPGGLALDNENRFLYVCDAGLDQVLVYDADPPFRLLRRIGTGGKQHTLTTPGDFAKPTNVAVDDEGNIYVSDTLNFRVEVFDAEGTFIRSFGKAGDGPGYFARPKGIAIDADGHVWVADEVQDRLQLFTPEGQLLMWIGGGHGVLPGQFSALVGVAVDRKTNRVFTTEQYPGRLQIFKYTRDAEALAEAKKRDEEAAKKKASGGAASVPAPKEPAKQAANLPDSGAAEKKEEAQPAPNPFAAARAAKAAEEQKQSPEKQ